MSESDMWSREFSKTHSRYYWFNSQTGARSWEEPEAVSNKKRKLETESTVTTGVDVAIIVPFRDLTNSDRTMQLETFVPKMVKFLKRSDKRFKIYIIEQSNDGRKFNRGKLLNIGFDIARHDGCNVFVFHDVDLLPSDELLDSYTTPPVDNPVHIARVWGRYSKNPSYFGGVVSFSRDQFEQINGFPNTFWGWGGEDDEMYLRVKACGFAPSHPTVGSITDMENMDLRSKLAFLKARPLLKCMNKNEALAEHDATWRENGLRVGEAGDRLHYKIESSRPFSGGGGRASPDSSSASIVSDVARCCTRYVVDVQLNGHWTDARCGVEDTQMDPAPTTATGR